MNMSYFWLKIKALQPIMFLLFVVTNYLGGFGVWAQVFKISFNVEML